MRVTAFILASWIFFLMALPALTKFYSSNKTECYCETQCCNASDECADSPAQDKEPEPNGCTPNTNCNPVECCTCCETVVLEKPSFNFVMNILPVHFVPMVNSKVISNYSAECFHPPEIVCSFS